MKILSIRIKNLASLTGEHFIDFESEPLASAGLVAIVGKTGAGKSTILDAMCLALFNKIPRLKDSDGKLTDVDGSELLTNSPLTVLRRGTAHGYAELCFVAQDQKHYIARWELKRSREKVDGKLQSVQRYIKCLTDGVVIADKAKAVEVAIQRITQLSFEQFTRAVLLAQSEVTAFLKARDNERGELLEYLTNSSIFAKIGQLAFEKTKSIAVQRKEIENVLGHIELLSEEAVTELNQNFKQYNNELELLEKTKATLAKQQHWFNENQKIETVLSEKQKSVDQQVIAHQSLDHERNELARLEIFATIRTSVNQQQQLIRTQQILEPQLKLAQENFKILEPQFELEKQQYIKAEADLKTLQDFEIEHHDALKTVRQCIVERDFIGQEFTLLKNKVIALEAEQKPLSEKQKQCEQQLQNNMAQSQAIDEQLSLTTHFQPLDSGIHAHIQQLLQFQQQYQNIQQNLGHIQHAKVALESLKVQHAETMTQYGEVQNIEAKLGQVRADREQKIAHLNQVESAQLPLKSYFSLQHEVMTQQQKLQILEIEVHDLNTAQNQNEQSYKNAQDARVNIEKLLQQQKILHAENIEKLRENLIPNEPCSVCGSTSHPYREDQEQVSKVLFELQQQQLQNAAESEQQLFQTWQMSLKKYTKIQTEQTQLKQQIIENVEKLAKARQHLSDLFSSFNVTVDLAQSGDEIQTTLLKTQTELTQNKLTLEQHLQELEDTLKNINILSTQIQNIEYQVKQEASLKQQVQHIIQCLDEAHQQRWQLDALSQTTQAITELKQRAEHLKRKVQCVQQYDMLQHQLTLLTQQIINYENILKQTIQARDDCSAKGQANSKLAIQSIASMTTLNDVKPHEWLAEHDTKRQRLQQNYQELKQNFEQLRHNYEKQQSDLQQIQTQHTQLLKSLENLDQDIHEWLTLHTDFKPQDLNHLLQTTPAQEKELRDRLQNVDRLLNESQSILKTIQEQHNTHLNQQPEIEHEKLNELVRLNHDALKEQFDALDLIKVELARHQDNKDKQAKFAKQIQEIQIEEHRWGKISGLMGDANGKKFRDYAQQYNLDILIEHANQQLSLLSQRYTLKRLENSLSLAIIDHDMDGETRSVASLSGGESFLTALALSLAIANMASGSMKIESLFIDEGFGTLDASSLHMVMNALDQLQNQGRKVVLISHIQEMHERIPVQIQVRPLGAGSSTIEVVS